VSSTCFESFEIVLIFLTIHLGHRDRFILSFFLYLPFFFMYPLSYCFRVVLACSCPDSCCALFPFQEVLSCLSAGSSDRFSHSVAVVCVCVCVFAYACACMCFCVFASASVYVVVSFVLFLRVCACVKQPVSCDAVLSHLILDSQSLKKKTSGERNANLSNSSSSSRISSSSSSVFFCLVFFITS